MKRQMFKKLKQPHILQAVLASVGVGIVGLSLLFVSFAATSTVKLYVSPASKNVDVDGTFSVQIRLQTNEQLRYAKAYLDFPADKLQVKSISSANSDFPSKTEETYDNAGGKVKIARFNNSSRSGSLLVASVTFQAKQNGSASVSFSSASVAASNQYYPYPNLLTAKVGGTYTITTPVVTPPPSTGSGSTPPPAAVPATPTPRTPAPSPAPTATTTPPPDTIDNLDPLPEAENTPSTSDPNIDSSAESAVIPTRRSRTAAVVAGVGVLTGLGAIGTAFVLNKRRPKISLLPTHDLTPEQVEAEMSTSLLPREESADAFNANQEAPAPESAEMEVPEPPDPAEPKAVPETSETDTPVPTEPTAEPPSLEPAAPAPPADNPDEPKDMFDVAEEQFHYDEKFKTPKK